MPLNRAFIGRSSRAEGTPPRPQPGEKSRLSLRPNQRPSQRAIRRILARSRIVHARTCMDYPGWALRPRSPAGAAIIRVAMSL